MRRLLKRIEERRGEYAQGRFFAFLRNRGIDIEERLGFAPHVAHFVMTFADLCTFVLPQEPTTDEVQALVNANCREDREHWQWYLSDLDLLGRHPSHRFGDAVRVIWNHSTTRTRRLSYELIHQGLGANAMGRLALICCIEGAFKTTVQDLEPAAQEFIARSGKQLRYLGNRHAEAEYGHTLENEEVRRHIERIELDAEALHRWSRMVDDVFARFRGFTDEMHDLARSR